MGMVTHEPSGLNRYSTARPLKENANSPDFTWSHHVSGASFQNLLGMEFYRY
jgi:hypothetical protein